MKVTCKYSGVKFRVELFDSKSSHTSICHPIFNQSRKTLLAFAKDLVYGKLSSDEQALLYLALANSSELLVWGSAVNIDSQDFIYTKAITFERLFSFITVLEYSHSAWKEYPKLHVTKSANFAGWLAACEEVDISFALSYVSISAQRELLKKEQALHKIFAIKHRRPALYGKVLADWAAEAGQFPSYITEYWKDLIRKAADNTKFLEVCSIPRVDLDELLCHMEDHMPLTSEFAIDLFAILREADTTIQHNTLDDLEVTEITEDDDVGLAAIILNAPKTKPVRSDYPTLAAYLKAQSAWLAAQRRRI